MQSKRGPSTERLGVRLTGVHSAGTEKPVAGFRRVRGVPGPAIRRRSSSLNELLSKRAGETERSSLTEGDQKGELKAILTLEAGWGERTSRPGGA